MADPRYAAPAVRYPLARSQLVLVLLLLLSLLGLLGLALWAYQGMGRRNMWLVAALVLWCVASVGCLRWWQGLPGAAFRWDGVQWWLEKAPDQELAVTLEIQWDAQFCLAVIWQESADQALRHTVWSKSRQTGYAVLSRSTCPVLWGDARRALYAPPVSLASSVSSADTTFSA